MQSIKRDLGLCLAMSALVFTCAFAWGYPFTTAASGAQNVVVGGQAQSQQPGQTQQRTQQKAETFVGTVVKSGSGYALRDSSGQMYMLDAPDQARAFEGKPVMVLGRLDTNANLIHVEKIQPSATY